MIGCPAISRALVTLVGLVFASAGIAQPKNEVYVFQYAGVVPGTEAASQFSVFRGILEDKILQLRTGVLPGDGKGPAYLRLTFRDKDTLQDEEVNQWLRNEGSVLCVLRGTIVRDAENYKVNSHIYLGELKEHLPYDVVRISLPIKSDQFRKKSDSHSVVILYALAMDAKRRGRSKSDIASFLTAATNKLADVKRRGQGDDDDLADLEKAIRAASKEVEVSPKKQK